MGADTGALGLPRCTHVPVAQLQECSPVREVRNAWEQALAQRRGAWGRRRQRTWRGLLSVYGGGLASALCGADRPSVSGSSIPRRLILRHSVVL